MLRNSITDFKEDLQYQRISSFSWLATGEMLADILTKECRKSKCMNEVLLQNRFIKLKNEDYKVVLGDGELKLLNKACQGVNG